ncbi:hypothetical protein [Tenacibaculum aiptasiae]|uniref:hypothetical protein n=1 Tax=Tenacibaculum aiptasiae TaxID=426481 RepID=UPI00232BDF3C|nr:hypothetical protein [Tenacibaculum aiptasiae]
MSLGQNLTSKNIVTALITEGLVLVKRTDLEEMMNKINLSNKVDNRNKYFTHKEITSMFGVTDYWLKKQREQPDTLIKSIPGENKNSAWKYKKQSIQDELDRLAI